MLTCIHNDSGLCPACQAEYDADPESWIEYGDHPEGIARFAADSEAYLRWVVELRLVNEQDPDEVQKYARERLDELPF